MLLSVASYVGVGVGEEWACMQYTIGLNELHWDKIKWGI